MKRALVLCGGGSLGAYEMGVWKYLRERGEKFDIVTGTSIGALNAAMYAADEYDSCLSLWEQVSADKVMKSGINIANDFHETMHLLKGKNIGAIIADYIKRGGVDITPFKKLVAKSIDPKKIKESSVICGVVTTDYKTHKEVDVVLNDEPVENILPWLHASSACFPIFPVETVNDKKYIDGGYCNNLPIDLALKLGAEEVVAVLLHSIPKNPQHPELMDLPFVHCIRPSRDTGSILYFKSSVLHHNLMLGYLDAMKSYDAAWGFSYCFKKTNKYDCLIEKAAMRFTKENLYSTQDTISAMFTNDMPRPKSSRDLFIRSLEIMASAYELDPYKIWDIDDIVEAIIEGTKKAAAPGAAEGQTKTKPHRREALKGLYNALTNGMPSSAVKIPNKAVAEFKYVSVAFELLLNKKK